MRYRPHDYQKFAIEYIKEHPIVAVILAMGMGKTSITLTAIEELMYDSFEISKVLIIAPLRVASTVWSDEIEQWEHLNHLTYSKILGTEKERLTAVKRKADIYLINRENLQWLIEKSGMPFDYDMVVIDELSSFKSWSSKRFKAFMKVRPRVKRIVGLTGTPSSNGLMDLFAKLLVWHFKVVRNYAVENKICMRGALNYSEIVNCERLVYAAYFLRKGGLDLIYRFVLCNYRVHMYDKVQTVLRLDLPLDIVDNIVHNYRVIFCGDLCMNACKLVLRTVVVYHKVVRSDNAVVAFDFALYLCYKFCIGRLAENGVKGVAHKPETAIENKECNCRTDVSVKLKVYKVRNHHCYDNGGGGNNVVTAVNCRCDKRF